MWCDSHCHLQWEGPGPKLASGEARDPRLGEEPGPEDLGTRARAAIKEARDAGVTRLVTVGTDAAQSEAALALAAANDGVWATVGLHPHDASAGVGTVERLVAGQAKLVGIGECGLDYHYDLSPRSAQREAFAAQVALARRYGLALVIHTRQAWDDTFDILRSAGAPEHTVFHCFTGGPAEALRALDMGAWLSFSGIVTFKNAGEVREAASLCPADRLLVETDSPYLAPVPHRGKPNAPKFVPLVGEAVAAAKRVAVEEVEQATWAAAEEVFGLGQARPRPPLS
ncbi:MAG: TatD family hydrolase [Actinobacteria bacterium]|nr:TatD family hydrolase [Actinomycetota bacterium]